MMDNNDKWPWLNDDQKSWPLLHNCWNDDLIIIVEDHSINDDYWRLVMVNWCMTVVDDGVVKKKHVNCEQVRVVVPIAMNNRSYDCLTWFWSPCTTTDDYSCLLGKLRLFHSALLRGLMNCDFVWKSFGAAAKCRDTSPWVLPQLWNLPRFATTHGFCTHVFPFLANNKPSRCQQKLSSCWYPAGTITVQ